MTILDFVIRRAISKDIPAVMTLLHETDFIVQKTAYNSPQYFEQSVESGIFFVAEVAVSESKLVGLIHGELLIGHGGVIWYFVVSNEWRKCGIGRQLLYAFETDCSAKGAHWIFGSADIKWDTIHFYKANHYEFGNTYIEFSKDIPEPE